MLAEVISVYIYSVRLPPKKLNDIFLKWLETHDVPSYREIQDALPHMKAKNEPERRSERMLHD